VSVDTAYLERIAELTLHARIAWTVAAVTLLLLAVAARRLSSHFAAGRAMPPGRRLAVLHSDRNATASMEYLMVLVPFLIIVMTIWQFAFMINARLHLGYATFAAARSAAVMIPAELDGEPAGKLSQLSGTQESKWTRIERAALPGTIAISPGTGGDAAGVYGSHNGINVAQSGSFTPPQTPDAVGTLARLTLMSMHMCDTPIFCEPQALTGTRPIRAAIKDYYAQNMMTVRVQGVDSSQDADLNGQEVIKVSVEYVFWLQVPWVGRVIEASAKGFLNPVTKDPMFFNPFPSITLTEETSINVWYKKRATDPC
jgi:hypothetical protein